MLTVKQWGRVQTMEGNGDGGMEEFKGGAETEGRDGTWNVYLFICFEH